VSLPQPIESVAQVPLQWQVPRNFLYPLFVADLERFFEKSPYTYIVVEGYRSLAEQEHKWTEWRKGTGPRAQAPGKSPHNHGCAAHVVPCTSFGVANWDIRQLAWRWVMERLPASPDDKSALVHGRTRWRWEHIEWRRWG
jgi:hypothetical protein